MLEGKLILPTFHLEENQRGEEVGEGKRCRLEAVTAKGAVPAGGNFGGGEAPRSAEMESRPTGAV